MRLPLTLETRILGSFVLAAVVVTALALSSWKLERDVADAARRATHTQEVLVALTEVEAGLRNTESNTRGYVITGDDSYLTEREVALSSLESAMRATRNLIGANATQQQYWLRLRSEMDARLQLSHRLVLVRASENFAAAQKLAQQGRGRESTRRIDSLLRIMEAEERQSLAGRHLETTRLRTVAVGVGALAALALLMLLAAAYVVIRRQIRAAEVRRAALESANRELAVRQHHSQLLTEMTGLLQTVRSFEEAAQVLPRFLGPLFEPNSGALYIIKSSRNYLDTLARWGEMPLVPTFDISDCWGLRRSQPYHREHTDGALVCYHTDAGARATLCVPMMAEGVTLGLLHLACAQSVPDAATAREWREHAQLVSEQLGLALANLTLRQQLREQSVHDIQTGLYNRRFLEESLPRELARAEREKYSVAVFMLDVDHFKKFNDSYGHEAGDAVLRALGRVITESVRASDFAYRFGGEEFTVALPRATLGQAREWADRFMQRVRGMEVKADRQSLPGVTVSLGLAFASEHGTDLETVIQAADIALYEAKRSGRDRLVMYATTHPGKTAGRETP